MGPESQDPWKVRRAEGFAGCFWWQDLGICVSGVMGSLELHFHFACLGLPILTVTVFKLRAFK